ncbi:MAG: S41 family peptidase [Patescibacteria group bacterium]
MFEFFKTRTALAVVASSALFLCIGLYVGYNDRPAIERVLNLSGKETAVATTADFSPFWEVWNIINEKYPGAEDVSDQNKVYGAIQGLISSLGDPYSTFFSPEEAKIFEEDISGSFSGVGMEIGKRGGVLIVIAPLKDTPAYRAGIKSGDRILKIDEELTTDLSVDEAVTLIRGERGTTVTFSLLREDEKEPREIKVVRDIINIPTLDTELRPDGIYLIRLYSFSGNSPSLFRDAVKKFSQAKTDKLLLDLRGNPGGYLGAAVSMASWFLPEGKVIVTEDSGEGSEPEVYRSKGYNVFNNKLKFVILIDSGSASASEILAGAMRDHKRAILVGSKSYGKGSVQEVVEVTGDTLLKLTVAKWLTPNGDLISETGLTPDYEVEPAVEEDSTSDPQMDKAVELLENWPGIE